VGRSKHVVGAEYHLRGAGRVAKVDEDHPAVVAPTRHPSGQSHLVTRIGGAQ
jgi:hypothetical protein